MPPEQTSQLSRKALPPKTSLQSLFTESKGALEYTPFSNEPSDDSQPHSKGVISTNEFISIKKLVNIIQKKLKRKNLLNLKAKERMGKDYAYKLSSIKLKKEIKWKPRTSLNQGIDETIGWIKQNFKYFKKNKTEYKHKR